MTWSQEISQLITKVDQLTNSTNVKKATIDSSVAAAEASRISANTSAVAAASSATAAATSANTANTHKTTALAVYGSTAAQQTAISTTQSQAISAGGSAASASAALQQDLTGVTSQALHRSPNAVTAMTIYDTSKDSDGGAWTEKCQGTSWYNEPLMGKWLGPQVSELNARYEGATLGAELVTNNEFNNGITGWTTTFTSTATVSGGIATFNNSSTTYPSLVSPSFATTVGKLYRVRIRAKKVSGTTTLIAIGSGAGFGGGAIYGSEVAITNDFVEYTLFATATATTMYAGIFGNSNPATAIVQVDSVSVREVIAFTTISSDYFQLTIDGKFYRLWKNRFNWTEDFSNVAWAKYNGTVTMNGVEGLFIPTATTGIHGIGQFRDATTHERTMTVEVKAAGYNRVVLVENVNTGATSRVVNLTDGSFVETVGGQTTVTPLADGWYRISWYSTGFSQFNSQWIIYPIPDTGFNFSINIFNQSWTADGVSGIRIRYPQLEYAPAFTSYETKGVEQITSEVFRGNKADFPRIAGIVTEGTSVNIYDLTEPGRPMWRRFRASGSTDSNIFWYSTVPATSVAALNGELCIGLSTTTGNFGGMLRLQFPTDRTIKHYNGSRLSSFADNIAKINDTLFIPNIIPIQVVPGSVAVNAIAMTILPDAPTDPVTGLRVPTIYIGTGGGVSRISHNGTVSSTITASTVPITKIYTDSKYVYAAGDFISGTAEICGFPLTLPLSGNASWLSSSWGTLGGFVYNGQANGIFNPIWPSSFDNATSIAGRVISHTKGISLLRPQPSASSRYLSGNISNTYNTGWMSGNIRRAYLSDIDAGTVTGPNLITNGTFFADTNWIKAGSVTIAGGAAQFPTGSEASLSQDIPIVPGKTYLITLTVNGTTGTSARVRFGGQTNSTFTNFTGNGTFSTLIVALTGSTQLQIHSMSATFNGAVDNISVREAILDRSYRNGSALIEGSLTKSQVATGTSLVGYSGFSAVNYLREPYSADLDFGVGEWNTSAWVNIPLNPELTGNISPLSNVFGSTAWVQDGVVTTADYETFGGRVYARLQQPAITTGGNRIFRGSAVTLAGNVNTSFYVRRVAGSSDRLRFTHVGNFVPAGDITYDPVTQTVTAGAFSVTIEIIDADTVRLSMPTGKYAAGGSAYQQIYVINSSNASFGTGTGGVLVSSFQMTVGSSVKPYEETGSTITTRISPIVELAAATGPRFSIGLTQYGFLSSEVFDGITTRTVTASTGYNAAQWLKADVNYTTDGTLAILINGREVATTRGTPLLSVSSRKNLLLWSEGIDNVAWGKSGVSVSGNVVTATNASAGALYQYTTIASGVIYTFSAKLKAGTASFASLRTYDFGTYGGAWFNLSNGTVGTVDSGITAFISPVDLDGYYRCEIRFSSPTNANGGFYIYPTNTNGLYSVTIGLTIQAKEAQLEIGPAATTYQRITIATDFDSPAPLTIGNRFALDAPFIGSIALLKLGATVPTSEQAIFMYEQEKQLFRAGAQSVLPDANSIIDMSYDDATDRWASISTSNESYWTGLIRNSVTPAPAGSYSKIATTSGIEFAARTTTNPGVDVTIPSYVLREELLKRSEVSSKLSRQTVVYDYVGGFTATTTSGSTALTVVTNLTYPTSYIGARISGAGIPANVFITGVSGTTIYISAAATATASAISMSFLDFKLPVGFETETVATAGTVRREGSTLDYTRLFDDFVEMIRFNTAPGSTTWVRIQASKV